MKPNQIPEIGKQYWFSFTANTNEQPRLVELKVASGWIFSGSYIDSGLPVSAKTSSLHETEREAWNAKADRVHTNGLENFWSLFKRMLKGTYVQVAPFHLQRYVDEESFRFNVRKTDDASRFATVMGRTAGRRITYRQLCQIDGCGFMGLV